MNNLSLQPQKSRHWAAFFLALLTASVIFLPFIIYNHGLFIYIGDFNVQQIPFYKLAHEAVRSGDIFWNWYTDLGANFIGSYSFYLLFSPFFWLTLPFPTAALPYLMAPLLVLKTACAALTSYFYIQRFVRDKNYAVIGAMLYAFSGFTAYNIFFNHFHEPIIFFPLMLIGLEELLTNNRHGVFALAVAVNAMVNYWFFVGEVVFIVLYYLIRCGSVKGAAHKFFAVAGEGILGVLCALWVLLPSALAVLGNPRTTFPQNALSGWQFWLYTHEQRQPGILSSFFFPPETPSRPNMFPDHGAKWASLSAWLPLFSMSGVLAYLISVRKNWLRRLLVACFIIAMVPGLNSLFVGLNNSYYTRWFYMLVLMLSLATVVALENEHIDLMRGFRWTVVITAAISAALMGTPVFEDGQLAHIGLAKEMGPLYMYVAMAGTALVLCYLLITRPRKSPAFTRTILVVLSIFSAGYTCLYLACSKGTLESDNYMIENGIHGREELHMPQETAFYRTDIYDSGDNFGMYWHLPNIQAFHSVVPTSIMEFYPQVGVKRDVSSRPDPKYYALRSLFSVKYLFIGTDKDEQKPMPGYRYVSDQLDFHLYENENYLPMGFAFDAYVDEEDWENVSKDDRHLLLMRALYLNDEQIARHLDILDRAVVSDDTLFSYDTFQKDVAFRRAMSCVSFEKDNRGFTAESRLDKERLMFFSVPYEKGWRATVNGQPALIEKVDVGFMAVRVPAGPCTIRFDYMTPGLLPGLCISGGATVVLVVILLVSRRKKPMGSHEYRLFDSETEFAAPDEGVFLTEYLRTDMPEEPTVPRSDALEDYMDWDETAFTGEAPAPPENTTPPKKPQTGEETKNG